MFNLYINETFKLLGRKPSFQWFIKLGMSRNTAYRLLNNKSKSVKLSALFDVCELLQCTPNDLLDLPDKVFESLHPSHPLRKLKKSPTSQSPADLIKSLPFDRLQEASELLQELKMRE